MKQIVFIFLGLLLLAIIAFFAWPEKAYKPYKVSEEYLAQVKKFNIPDMPDDWEWGRFASEDGVKMRFGQTGNSGAARATVILIPGYTATLNMYGEQVAHIAARGYHVVGFDLRGQGGSERARANQPEKLYVRSFKVYANDLALFLQKLDIPEDRPVILMGMSFGGHVAFRVGVEHPDLVDGLLLLAPALRPKAGDMSFEEVLRLLKVGDFLGKDKRYLPGQLNWVPVNEDNLLRAGMEQCSSDIRRAPMRDAVFTLRPNQRVGGVTFNWGREFYRSSALVLQPGYPEALEKPVTMIHAEKDDFVVTEINKQVCDTRISDCRSVAIPETAHCLTQETDRVLDKIYRSLDQLVGRAEKKPT